MQAKISTSLNKIAIAFKSETVKWTKFTSARDSDGRLANYNSRRAVSFCAYGMVCKMFAKEPERFNKALDYLSKTDSVILSLAQSLPSWNDYKAKSTEEVVRLFREAAQLAEKDGR